MFCENCGKQNIKFAKFCKYCGFKLEEKLIDSFSSNDQNVTYQDPEKVNKQKLRKNLLERIITRLVISSVDFFFAGIFLFTLIIVFTMIGLFQNSFSLSPLITFLILSFVWFIYILSFSLIYKGRTFGEQIVNVEIKSKNKFLLNLLGPLIIFDFILENTFYVKPMKGRMFSYIVCFIILTWWEYLLFIYFLFMPFSF